jgi:hypothetical protein
MITKNSDRTLVASIRWVVVDSVRGCLLPVANAINTRGDLNTRRRSSRAWVPDYRSSETDHAANTAHGTNRPAITNPVLLRTANQPISYPNNTVSPAPTTSKVA